MTVIPETILNYFGGNWQHSNAVDNLESSELYEEFNNQTLTEDELIDILGTPPQYIEDDDN